MYSEVKKLLKECLEVNWKIVDCVSKDKRQESVWDEGGGAGIVTILEKPMLELFDNSRLLVFQIILRLVQIRVPMYV